MTISTVSFPASSLTSTTTTLAPSLAKSSDDSRPMPPPAPVINATLSFSLIRIREWGVGSGEQGSYFPLPTPYSPLLTPHSLSFYHSTDRCLASLADFSGDARDQGALFVVDPSGPKNAACNRRSDLAAISDQVSSAGHALLFRQKIEDDADGAQRILEELLRRPDLHPVRQHFVGHAVGRDASGLRDLEDHLAFAVRDAALGPGHLDERDYVEQRNRLRRVAQVLQCF